MYIAFSSKDNRTKTYYNRVVIFFLIVLLLNKSLCVWDEMFKWCDIFWFIL